MKKAIFLAIILGIALGFACAAVNAEETTQTQPPAKATVPAPEGQEAYGEVVSVDANAGAITITEYDYEKDEDVNKSYTIDKAATFENVKSLSEVKTGDWVALTLKPQKDGTNLATSVYVERYDIGEEAAPAQQAVPTQPAPVAQPAAPATPAASVAAPAPAPVATDTTVAPAAAEATPAPMPEAPAQQ